MRHQLIVGLTVLLLASMGEASSRAGELLRWKLAAGQELKYVMRQKATTSFNAEGLEFEIKTEQTLDMTWMVQSVADDGAALLAQRVDRLRLSVGLPQAGPLAGDFNYDSDAKADGSGLLWEQLKGVLTVLPGAEFLLRVSPKGDVTDIELPAEVVKALESSPRNRRGFGGRNLLNEESIRQMLEMSVQSLPAEAADAGASWSRKFNRKVPEVGTLAIDAAYTLGQPETIQDRSTARIAVQAETAFERDPETNAQLSLELSEQKATGAVLFDAAAGHTVASKFELYLVFDGESMETAFTQESTTIIQLHLAGFEDALAESAE